MGAVRPSRGFGIGLLFPALLLAGCAQQDEAGDGAAVETPAAGAAAMDGAPPCTWTDSGDELAGRASPPDSAAVQLGDGVAKVCYSAPSARDREVMGGLVPYGRPWRLGANEPTTIHVTVPAEIGAVRVEPGSYSLYAIPGESGWTIVVNRSVDRWGIPIDEGVRAQDAGSFTVTPQATDHVERFAIGFEPGGAEGAQMAIAWETTRVAFPVRPTGN